jgi:hypothetical protein
VAGLKRAFLIGVLAACAGGSALAADKASPRHGAFHTPSSNIVCSWSLDDGAYPPFLRCDIRSGLKPFPRRPRSCPSDSDYGQGLQLLAVPRHRERGKGMATVVCAGDTVLGERGPALSYGKRFARGGLTCVSRASGLACRNVAGRGFFLSRQRWRIF